jgi:hypothetical protein
MSRKPRSDCKLLNLDEDDQVKIFDWLRSLGYAKTKVMVQKELEISTSLGALNNFYDKRFEKHQRLRLMKAASAAKVIEAEAEQDFSPHLAKLFGQLAFEAGIDERRGAAEEWLKLARGIKADMMKEDRFQLEMRKFQESLKSKQEIALDALFADIQGNAEAEAIFNRLRDAVMGVDADG